MDILSLLKIFRMEFAQVNSEGIANLKKKKNLTAKNKLSVYICTLQWNVKNYKDYQSQIEDTF